MELANKYDIEELLSFYSNVIENVNKSNIKLGWNIEFYPNRDFLLEMIDSKSMFVIREDNTIVGAAAVNHTVNEEYSTIDWNVKHPADKIATVHASMQHTIPA